jgi:hypothetical protein
MNAYPTSTSLLQSSLREDYAFSGFVAQEKFRAAHAPGISLAERHARMTETTAWYRAAKEIGLILFRGGDHAPLWN